MADLYNTRLRKIERNVSEKEVQGRIQGGEYDFLGGPNSKVFISTGNGRAIPVASHLAARYIRDGAQYLTPLAVQQLKENNEFADSALGSISAIASGGDDYLFAGGGAHALEAMGILPEGRVESVQAAHPYIHHGSGVGLSILAALGTGGASAEAQAAAQAAKLYRPISAAIGHRGIRTSASIAAQNAAQRQAVEIAAESMAKKGFNTSRDILSKYTLPGIGAKLGRATGDMANEALMKMGGKYVPFGIGKSEIARRWGPNVAKVMSSGIGAGVEMGVWGAGTGISESIIGAPGESAEHILDSIGTNFLIGMAFGGGIAGLIPFLTGAGGLAANAADKLLDISGVAGNKTTKLAAPFIDKVAKAQNYGPEERDFLKKVLTETDGDKIQQHVADLIKGIDDSSAEAARILDLLRITEQFQQLADIKGHKLESLIDAVTATLEKRAIHHDIGAKLDVDPAMVLLKKGRVDLRVELGKEQVKLVNIKGTPTPAQQAPVNRILKEITDQDDKIAAREKAIRQDNRLPYLDDEFALPETIKEVLDNTAQSYQRTRIVLGEVRGNFPDANVPGPGGYGAIDNLIYMVNEAEAKLYTELFSEDNFKRAHAKFFGEVGPAPGLNEAEEEFLNSFKEFFGDMWSAGVGRKRHPIFERIKKKAIEEGRPLDYDFETWQHAFSKFASTGNTGEMETFLSQFTQSERKEILRSFGFSDDLKHFIMDGDPVWNFEKVRKLAKKKRTVTTEDSAWQARAKSFKNVRKNLEKYLKQVRLRGRADPSFQKNGFLDFKLSDGTSLRQHIDANLISLDYRIYDSSIVARAFKSLENIQTTVLKATQHGVIPEHPNIVELFDKNIIDMLRKEMKQGKKWGQMAHMKQRFDDLASDFGGARDQVAAALTKIVGTTAMSDPKAMKALLRNSDKHSTDIVMSQIAAYGDIGRELLNYIRRDFEHMGLDEIPDQILSVINKRLKLLDTVGFGIQKPMGKYPGVDAADWDSRLERMIEFSRTASTNLRKHIGKIKNAMPLAEAFISTSARDANMANAVSDLGRGGVIAALTYGMTGSPMASAVSGLAVGASSMALSPQRILGLMHQMTVLKKASQEQIKEYMVDWAASKVPKSAITKNWEKASRSMFMVAAQPVLKDKRESRQEMRKKMAKNRTIEAWSGRISEALNTQITEENYAEARFSLTKLVGSEFLMDRFTDELTRMFEQMPEIRDAMKAVIEQKINLAYMLMPKSVPGSMFGPELVPSEFELREFATHLQVLNRPKETMLTAMLTGTLTPGMVNTMKTAWPKLYAELVSAAMEAVADPKVKLKLTQQQKITLSTLTGMPIMGVAEATILSNNYKEEEEGGAQQRAPTGRPFRQIPESAGAGTIAHTLNR